MAQLVLRQYPKMDLETSDLARIRQYLAQKQAHADYVLPKGLQKAAGTGCAILNWRGQPVTMICFHSGRPIDPTEPSDLFLFVIDRKAVPKVRATGKPQFAQLNRLATLTWGSGDKAYVLGGLGDEQFLRQYY
jgi:hypothetical protein